MFNYYIVYIIYIYYIVRSTFIGSWSSNNRPISVGKFAVFLVLIGVRCRNNILHSSYIYMCVCVSRVACSVLDVGRGR